jgi:hypothetical protein
MANIACSYVLTVEHTNRLARTLCSWRNLAPSVPLFFPPPEFACVWLSSGPLSQVPCSRLIPPSSYRVPFSFFPSLSLLLHLLLDLWSTHLPKLLHYPALGTCWICHPVGAVAYRPYQSFPAYPERLRSRYVSQQPLKTTYRSATESHSETCISMSGSSACL